MPLSPVEHHELRKLRREPRGHGEAAAGDAVAFEAETVSPKYGKLQWKGVVRGDKLDATATSLREGKAPIENWVVAGAPR